MLNVSCRILFIALFIVSCGGGGSNTPSQGSTAPSKSPDPVSTIGSAPDAIKAIQQMPLKKILEASGEKKYFTRSEIDELIRKLLAQNILVLNEMETEIVAETLFSKPIVSLAHVDSKKIFQESLSDVMKRYLENLPKPDTLDPNANLDVPSGKSEAAIRSEIEALLQAHQSLQDAMKVSGATLDKNGDGVVNILDNFKRIKPKYHPDMSAEEIKQHYHYWDYFIDTNTDNFKNNIWPKQDGFHPPTVYHSDDAVILDFEGELGLIEKDKDTQSADTEAEEEQVYEFVPQKGPYQRYWVDRALLRPYNNNDDRFMLKLITNLPSVGANVILMGTRFKKIIKSKKDPEKEGEAKDRSKLDEILIEIEKIMGEKSELKDDEVEFKNDIDQVDSEDAIKKMKLLNERIKKEFSILVQQQKRILQEAADCSNNYGYNEENGCKLKKVYQALYKLQGRVDRYLMSVGLNVTFLEMDYEGYVAWQKQLLSKDMTHENIEQKLARVHKALLAAFVANVITSVMAIVQSVSKTFLELGLAATSGMMIESGLNKAADLLGFLGNLPLLKKMSAKLAANIGKVAEFCKHLSKVAKTGDMKGFSAGIHLLLSFGPSLVEDMEMASFNDFIDDTHRKDNLIAKQIFEIGRLLKATKRHKKDIETIEVELIAMFDEVKLALEKSETHRVEAADQCRKNYEDKVATLQEGVEKNIQTLDEDLNRFKSDYEKAQEQYEKFEDKCEENKFNRNKASRESNFFCIQRNNKQPECDQAIARFESLMDAYRNKLRCLDEDAPAKLNLKQSGLDLKAAKSEHQASIEKLNRQLAGDIVQQAKIKEQCLAQTSPSCDINFKVLYEDSSKNILPVLIEANDNFSKLKIKCFEDVALMAPSISFCETKEIEKRGDFVGWGNQPVANFPGTYTKVPIVHIRTAIKAWLNIDLEFPQDWLEAGQRVDLKVALKQVLPLRVKGVIFGRTGPDALLFYPEIRSVTDYCTATRNGSNNAYVCRVPKRLLPDYQTYAKHSKPYVVGLEELYIKLNGSIYKSSDSSGRTIKKSEVEIISASEQIENPPSGFISLNKDTDCGTVDVSSGVYVRDENRWSQKQLLNFTSIENPSSDIEALF